MEASNLMDSITPYSAEWFQQRLGKFTSSEVWKLMGEPKVKSNEWSEAALTYIYEKVAERSSGMAKAEVFSNATDWGHAYELDALQAVSNHLNEEIIPGWFIEHNSYCGGTPDGIIKDSAVVEIKCPYNSGNHIENLLLKDQNDLRKHKKGAYYWQVVANCMFLGLTVGYLCSFDPRMPEGKKLKVIRVDVPLEDLASLQIKLQNAENYCLKIEKELNKEVI